MKQPGFWWNSCTISSLQGKALGLNFDNKFTVWSQVGSPGEAFGIWPVKAVGNQALKRKKRNEAAGSKVIDYIRLNCF